MTGAIASVATAYPNEAADPEYWPRIFGEDRYETAIAVAKYEYPYGAEKVYVASGTNWPDALSGSTLVSNGPILLVKNPVTREVLQKPCSSPQSR